MSLSITKRTLIRLISFAVAIILVSSVLIYNYAMDATRSRRALEYHYMKSIDDLTTYSQNINSDLTKALYTKTPAMLSELSSKLWRESGFAKDTLNSLPIEYLNLKNTNKLLSQVGDYCVSLSKSFAKGDTITKEQRDNLEKLNKYCNTMTNEISTVSDGIKTGALSLSKVRGNINRDFDSQQKPAEVAEGFNEFEEGFTSYPTLLYDGPFSDNILKKEPERLKAEQNVSRDDARKKASKATILPIKQLKDAADEDSKMPSYCFKADGVDVSITKKGGLISYMLKSRMVSESKIGEEEAQKKARTYMDSLGIGTLETSYYEISSNIITINYAYLQDNIVVYPDLIKVSIALDNGEVLGFDSRGYIVNHKKRDIKPPKYTADQAKQSVSDYLTIESSRLCIVPSAGLSELLCYEYKCKSKDKKDILVYVNADTKAEERILILLIGENGTLTI